MIIDKNGLLISGKKYDTVPTAKKIKINQTVLIEKGAIL